MPQIKRLTLGSVIFFSLGILGGGIAAAGKLYTIPDWLGIVGAIMAFSGSSIGTLILQMSPIPLNNQGKVDVRYISTSRMNW